MSGERGRVAGAPLSLLTSYFSPCGLQVKGSKIGRVDRASVPPRKGPVGQWSWGTRSRPATTRPQRAASRCGPFRRRIHHAAARRPAAPRAEIRTACSASSSGIPSNPKIRRWSCGSAMRRLPPPSSVPFSTMSYASARAFSGAVSSNGRSSGCGAVNGWFTGLKAPVVGSFSNSGKSTIQTKRLSPSGMSLSRLGQLLPHAVERRAGDVVGAGDEETRDLRQTEPVARQRRPAGYLAAGPSRAPPAAFSRSRPAAPSALAAASISSTCFRVSVAPPGTLIPRTLPPASIAERVIEKSAPRNTSVASKISKPVAQVRLVAAVPLHRLGVAHALDRQLDLVTRLSPDAPQPSPRRIRARPRPR